MLSTDEPLIDTECEVKNAAEALYIADRNLDTLLSDICRR